MIEAGTTKTNGMKSERKITLSKNALTVLERRYLAKDEEGNVIETPVEMFRRVARNIAAADALYGHTQEELKKTEEKFFQIITQLEFLPNSPTLMNAGRELQQLSACFVLPIEDSTESIFDAVKYAALVHKSGGGTGFSFSRLRPKNDRVRSTGGIASGPVSFMKVFNVSTEVIKQGGTRRGANMAILRVDNPDILEFIASKKDVEAFTNFNISVALTKEFIKALKEDRDYILVNPRTKEIIRQLNAKYVWDLIIEMAWKTGEPGIVFLDRINAANPTPLLGEIEATNPCGEQPLLPYESCNLGSINVAKLVQKNVYGEMEINFEKLRSVIRTAVHFLDNVIDINDYPLPVIEKMTKGNRKIGLGVMGFADMLIKLGIPYDSIKAIEVAKELMQFISNEAWKKSQELAEERGAFINFKGSIYDKPGHPLIRNATVTTIAPTGTLSIIANCSSGIEPLFSVTYVRNVLENEKLIEVNDIFKKIMTERGIYSEELIKKIATKRTLRDVEGIPQDIIDLFVTAHEISPIHHIRIQAAFQKYVDNAVSKTVNLNNNMTKKDVKEVFNLAYELGCKGVTVYRDGSRPNQVLSTNFS